MKVAVFRRAHFNAAHRLYNPDWTHQKNVDVFGVCTSPNFHGHNYDLEVKVVGEVDPTTGMVINLKELANIIKIEIEDRYDHKNLNLDVDDFKEINPTAENLCYVIWTILRKKLDDDLELTVRLFETPRIFVEYPA